jgi:hypothetical protein
METLTLRPNEAPVIGSRYSAVTGSRPCKLHPAIRRRDPRDRFVTRATVALPRHATRYSDCYSALTRCREERVVS